MADAFEIAVDGTFDRLSLGEPVSKVRELLGEPEIFEPARKSNPAYLVYGPIEFRFRKDRLLYIGITLYVKHESFDSIVANLDEIRTLQLQEYLGLLTKSGTSFALEVHPALPWVLSREQQITHYPFSAIRPGGFMGPADDPRQRPADGSAAPRGGRAGLPRSSAANLIPPRAW